MKSHQLIKKPNGVNEYIFRVVEKDLEGISESQFVQLMSDLLSDVADEYTTAIRQKLDAERPKYIQKYCEAELDVYYQKLKKYKRQSAINQVLDEIDKKTPEIKARAEEKADKYLEREFNAKRRIYWDVMPMCFDNATPSYTIVSAETTDSDLRKNYEYFKELIDMASGIVFKYETYKDSADHEIPEYASRPWIEFIIPEDVMNTLKDEKYKKDMGVYKFYNSLKYKGD